MAREYKDSGIEWIGQIPKEWEVELIGNNIKEINDKNDDSSEDNALQFKMGSIISKKGGDSKYNPESLAAYTKVKEGDIVINGLNLSFDLISQRVGLVREKGVITSTYLTLRPSSLLHSVFVNYLFKAYDNCKAFHGMGRGLRQILAYRELKNQKLIYPPLPEQQKIADYLDKVCDEIDEMVALQETMIEELKAYKQSVITEAVTKGLNPNVSMRNSGIDWIGEIPEHWDVIKLGRIFTFQGGFAFKSDGYVAESNNQVIRIGNVKNNLLLLDNSPVYIDDNLAEIASNYKLNENCILFTMTGTKGKRDYFFTLLLKKEHLVKNLFLNQRVGCFIAKENVCPNYYNYLLKDNGILDCIFFYETGTANQGNLGIDSISRTLLQMPPYDEQRKIASYLDTKCSEIDSLIALKQTKIEELKEYKKSVIYEYVTGKKEVV